VEDSESAKQKSKQWQPGSVKAQFGIKDDQKNFLFRKSFTASSQPSLPMGMPIFNRNISLS
jgi:hypothetical protein